MPGSEDAGRIAKAPRFNSLLSHALLLAIGMVTLFVGTSMCIMVFRASPSSNTISLYETARLMQRLPIGKTPSGVSVERTESPPRSETDATSRILADGLAAFTGQPREAVRLHLEPGPQVPLAVLERERQLFSADRAFNPTIFGAFTASLRNPDGSWTTVTRRQTNPFVLWQIKHLYFILGWSLFGLLLALWFSHLIAKPIRQFSEATERVMGGNFVAIPETGPNEIRQAARTLNEMQTRIRNYVAERTSMVGAIAHDLRSPLSRLNFYLAGASDEIRANAQAEIREMEELIRVTLDFVEHDSRPPEPERLDLSLLVEGIIDDYHDMGGNVQMAQRGSMILTGDALLLKRLFANLIGNALKYAGGASVAVHEDQGFAVVDVVDEGPGMSNETIARAFEPFYRGEPSRNRRTGGVGLGLSIVKFAVDSHDGSVELANLEQGGLRARVKIPLSVD